MTEPVNINTATFLQLKSLKGIGEAKANAILRAREEKAVKPSGEDLASTVALLRDKISSIEKDRSDMVVSFQLQADQLREEPGHIGTTKVAANYKLFCQKFNEKFGKKELPHILRRLLQDLRQENEENLRDFAERAQELAVDGYPDTPEKFAETLATDAFLRGCLDKRAALVAMDKNPESLDQAVQFVRSAAANQKVIMGGKKSEVKRVTFSDTEDVQEQEEEKFAVRVVEKDDDKKGVSASIEKRLKKTEDDLAETKIIVKKILNIINQNQGQNQRSRSTYRSPTPERSTSPYRGTGCFQCGKEGHYFGAKSKDEAAHNTERGKGSEMEARYTDDLDVTVNSKSNGGLWLQRSQKIDFLNISRQEDESRSYTCQEHVSHYAALAAPLHVLTGGKEFKWESEHQDAFNSIKKALTTPPVLGYPDPNFPFILDTDASENTIGAELSQIQNGKCVTVSYASRVLTPAQRKYCTTRKELLAIVAFTRQYRHYLLGNQFTIRTDHNSLKWLMNFKNIEGQLARWLEELSQYNLIIQHRPGKKHSNADGLSRIPNHQDLCSHYSSEIPLNLLPCGGCKYCTRARSQWQIFEEDVDFVVPLTARSVSCTSPVGIIGLTIRSIRNVTSDNNVSIMGMPTSYSNDDLRQLQNQDKHLSTIIAWLTLNYTPSKQELQMQSPGVRHLWQCKSQLRYQDSILSYIWEDPVGSRILFVTPDSLKDELLRCCHDLRSSGHLGQDKTLSKLRKTAYWLKLSQIRDLPVWTQRLKRRILEQVERKMLEDLTDKEEHCDLGLDWLFSNNEPMLWNMIDGSLAQSDSLTGGGNTGIGQSDFLTNKRSSQEADQFTLQDWETLMNLDDNFGDQTIIYNVADTVEAQVKLSDRSRGRDRKAPAHFRDFVMD
ncbi:unnamed protein product [Mytilus edulis]|uniref:Uncharacterized protein n=1 Tax=Mytilus edulis TaxID=6550 RepID=A0A8S3QZG5_MYTED|nr:unnamed protein product [Mytilus edulis]